jgi:hypothetical protein
MAASAPLYPGQQAAVYEVETCKSLRSFEEFMPQDLAPVTEDGVPPDQCDISAFVVATMTGFDSDILMAIALR